METRTLGRRQILRGAGVAAGGMAVVTVGLAAPAKADDGRTHGGLLGAWLITRRDDGDGSISTGVVSFASGGVVFYQDTNPSGPAFVGAFAQNRRRFRSTIISGSKADDAFPGSPALTQEVHTEGTLDDDTISGTYNGTATDATTGDPVGAPVSGTFTATRLNA